MRKSIIFIVAGCCVGGAIAMSGCAGEKTAQAPIQAVGGSDAKEMNAARAEFEKTEDPPLTPATHFAAGQLNETQGSLPLAIEQYQAALKLDPKCVPAMFRLAYVYSQMKDYPKAIGAWNQYIDATDKSAVGYSDLGYCQELSGDPEAAERSYQAGIERDPANQPCRVNYGLMLARQGKIEEAKAQFGAVLSPAEAHYNIASVLQQQGKKDAARAEFKEAIKTDPKMTDAAQRLAELDKN
jgi:tetratricopeptide (TPR) repeat protein